jgi:hypothetical protein
MIRKGKRRTTMSVAGEKRVRYRCSDEGVGVMMRLLWKRMKGRPKTRFGDITIIYFLAV